LWENWHSDSREKTEYDTHFFESHDKIKAQVNLKKQTSISRFRPTQAPVDSEKVPQLEVENFENDL